MDRDCKTVTMNGQRLQNRNYEGTGTTKQELSMDRDYEGTYYDWTVWMFNMFNVQMFKMFKIK